MPLARLAGELQHAVACRPRRGMLFFQIPPQPCVRAGAAKISASRSPSPTPSTPEGTILSPGLSRAHRRTRRQRRPLSSGRRASRASLARSGRQTLDEGGRGQDDARGSDNGSVLCRVGVALHLAGAPHRDGLQRESSAPANPRLDAQSRTSGLSSPIILIVSRRPTFSTSRCTVSREVARHAQVQRQPHDPERHRDNGQRALQVPGAGDRGETTTAISRIVTLAAIVREVESLARSSGTCVIAAAREP